MVMRVFVAGGTGVVGRRLVPQLVARGHQVTATTTSTAKLGLLRQLGAGGVVMDGLDAISVGAAVAAARPDAIVHQMTGLSEAHAGRPNLRKPDRFFAATYRLRTEGTSHLLAAAEAAGVPHVVAQSAAIFNGTREGGPVKTEEDPLEAVSPAAIKVTKAINQLEDAVAGAGGAVMRYGSLYGPGAIDDQVKLVRRRLFPLVGGGGGASDIRTVTNSGGSTLPSRLIVAGGAGGSSGSGGSGGTAGGTGALGAGGASATAGSGGGGGGLYGGGGGGGAGMSTTPDWGGGGGGGAGSSFATTDAGPVTSAAEVSITYNATPPPVGTSDLKVFLKHQGVLQHHRLGRDLGHQHRDGGDHQGPPDGGHPGHRARDPGGTGREGHRLAVPQAGPCHDVHQVGTAWCR
jgi:NAD-dependent epimerase/dehydratase family protein